MIAALCVEVQDMAAAVLNDEEAVQQPKRRGRHGEQIHRCDLLLVVPQERNPTLDLIGLRWEPRHVSRHRLLRDDEAELHELGVDTRCAPAVLRHRTDESANLGLNPRSAWIASARDPSPVSSESFPIPLRDCVCVDDDQAARPRRPRASERNPECAVRVVEGWPGSLFLERRHLLPQSEVSITRSARRRHIARNARAPSETKKMSTRSMAAEFRLLRPGTQAGRKSLIAQADEY